MTFFRGEVYRTFKQLGWGIQLFNTFDLIDIFMGLLYLSKLKVLNEPDRNKMIRRCIEDENMEYITEMDLNRTQHNDINII